MSNETATLNTLWAQLIVEELIRNGVDTFVISPGSRSTPLTVAAARNARAKTVTHFDERGAAFFALGVARATGKPAALICTSGTAVANYFPAIVEASMSCVPLIVLTADRPPELQNTGANQTIHQTNIYGEYARKYVAMPCPEEGIGPEIVLTNIDHAVYIARRLPFGPVHINCPFREPLGPVACACPESLSAWLGSQETFTYYPTAHVEANVEEIERLKQSIAEAERLLIVIGNCGPAGGHHGLPLPTKWPVISDISSNNKSAAPGAVPNFDQLLLSESFRALARPDFVLHVGGPLVSKRIQEFLVASKPKHYVHVSTNGQYLDPGHSVTQRMEIASINDLLFHIELPESQTPWTQQIIEASARAEGVIAATVSGDDLLTEPSIARVIARESEEWRKAALFVGNSMPVRDMEMFAGSLPDRVRVVANRGASGIDGNIATAAGFAQASGYHVTAVIGDVAALHDLNSLALLAREEISVVLIIINNDGGGIFHFLPIAEQSDVFEPYFATPHGRRFEDAARMFGLPYAQPKSMSEFLDIYRKACATGQSQIIEVATDRAENRQFHKQIGDALTHAVDMYCAEGNRSAQ